MPRKPKKLWSKVKDLPIITPSKCERNESAKPYWRKVIAELELTCKDDKFWESQQSELQRILPDLIYNRLAKLYNIDKATKPYEVRSEASTIPSSGFYYKYHVDKVISVPDVLPTLPQRRRSKSLISLNRTFSKQSRHSSRASSASKTTIFRTHSRISRLSFKKKKTTETFYLSSSESESTDTRDDLIVNIGDETSPRGIRRHLNPHYDLFKTNKPLRDIITWNSKLKPSQFQISESDAFDIKVEMLSRKIAQDFFTWYTAIGSPDFVSEIKKPEDIETLFQVWFDEHASKSIMLCPKILPCVLEHIAKAVGVPELACTYAVQEQVNWDIKAEKDPKKLTAFNCSLPNKLKHIPPKNDTEKLWRALRIPEDLKTMACVFDGIQHLTSTKEFHKWLKKRPYLPMPEYFANLDRGDGKKQLFAIPSDYILPKVDDDEEVSDEEDETENLKLPLSAVNLEMKTVLKELMD